MRIAHCVGIISYSYVNNIVIGSKDIKRLQETLNDKVELCSKHTIEINIAKTQMFLFSKAVKIPASAEIFIQKQKLKIGSDFKNLGVTLKTSTKCLSKHVSGKAIQAIIAMLEINCIRTYISNWRGKVHTILIEDLRTHLLLPNTDASERPIASFEGKREDIYQKFYSSGAMIG